RDRDWAPFPRIFSIYEDRQGTLWIGTEGGLNRFDRETEQFTHFLPDTTHTRFNNRVVAIHEDRSGRLWLGTYMGLVLFDRDTETFTYFNEQDGLADNFVNGILEDDAGNLWLSTNSGRLSRFIPATRTFRNFDGQDGLVNNFFYPGSHQRSRRGELIFGSPAGLVIFHPDSIQASTYVPPVALTSFEVFGRRVKLDQALPYTQEIELFPDQNTFSFEFTALDFSAPDRNLYAYKLEGFDADWMENGTRRRASYTNVPPGTYTFRVKGSSSDHVWNEEGVSVRLVITPPFWRTGWFYALVVIFGLSLIGVVGYGVRVRRLKAREQELSRMVEERTQALVAEKKKTEEQAEKLQEQADRLLELDRIKSRFFANISHEFRTPLTLLLGPLQDALDGEREMDALRRHLPTMHRNARRLLRLINQLLDLSKLEAGSMTLRARRANLIPLLRATAEAFTSMARRKHITLQVQTSQEEIVLYYEQDKLEKVFYNLLSNAFKYTPEGGTVSVSVEEGEGEASGFVEIVVRDTGRGIPAEDLPYIFDRFTTVNLRFHQVDASSTREHEGTGIGLALTKELVALHGGTIRVESEWGRGTAIFIRLPRGRAHLHDDDIVDEDVGDEMQALAGLETFDLEASLRAVDEVLAFEGGLHERAGDGQPAGPLPEDAPTILIVEDNADVRGYLMSHLEGDYHVVEAADGVEGLDQAQAIKPDLVIVDVMMPRMDGYALCRALKADEKISHIPVVLLTARADEESKVMGLETGADDYLYKPFNAAELLARVENLIEIRRQLRERFSETIVVQPGDIEITSAEADFLKQVQGIVEAHLADRQFSVEWLASEVALSRRQLDRRLRSLTRLSASGFIRKMRLERAAQLLVQQAGKVSEVAYAVGFQDVAHFSKLFRQTFGVPPSEYAMNGM
ncbi:MAG: response regulator, partial [Acidobacteria bacterium]|nr:response regulator [Acidobacteriota bacterium]